MALLPFVCINKVILTVVAKRVSWAFLKIKEFHANIHRSMDGSFSTQDWFGLLLPRTFWHWNCLLAVSLHISWCTRSHSQKSPQYHIFIWWPTPRNASKGRALLHLISIIKHAYVSEHICLCKLMEGVLIVICWWVKRAHTCFKRPVAL